MFRFLSGLPLLAQLLVSQPTFHFVVEKAKRVIISSLSFASHRRSFRFSVLLFAPLDHYFLVSVPVSVPASDFFDVHQQQAETRTLSYKTRERAFPFPETYESLCSHIEKMILQMMTQAWFEKKNTVITSTQFLCQYYRINSGLDLFGFRSPWLLICFPLLFVCILCLFPWTHGLWLFISRQKRRLIFEQRKTRKESVLNDTLQRWLPGDFVSFSWSPHDLLLCFSSTFDYGL